MQPIDYMGTINAPDIGASLLQGLRIGASIQDVQAATELKQQKVEEAKRAAEESDRYQSAVRSAMDNPTPEKFAQLTLLHPQHGESINNAAKNVTAAQKDREFNIGMGVYNLIRAGKIDAARSHINEQIAAAQNSGRDVTNLNNMLRTLDSDPKQVQGQLGFVLSGIDPDRFSTMSKTQQDIELQPAKVAGEEAKTAKTEAEILKTKKETENLQSEIENRAKKYELDVDTLKTNTQLKVQELTDKNKDNKLSDAGKKTVNESVVAGLAHESAADEMDSLATKLIESGGGKGVITSGVSALKNTFGWQNPRTELLNRYERIRNSAAMKSLPPGPATDKDMETARQGMPPVNADADHIASFLRGMAKIERLNAQIENSKSEWVAANGSLAPLAKDTQIGNTLVPAGTAYHKYSKQFNSALADKSAATSSSGQVQGLFSRYPPNK